MEVKLGLIFGNVNDKFALNSKRILAHCQFSLTLEADGGIITPAKQPSLSTQILKRFTLLLAVLGVTALSCENNPATPITEPMHIVIRSAQISPSQIQFSPSDGVKDSTVTMELLATMEPVNLGVQTTLSNLKTAPFVWELRSRSDGGLQASGSATPDFSTNTLSASISLALRTFDFEDYVLYLYATDEIRLLSNTVQSRIAVRGFPIGVPQILEVRSPGNVTIPTSGSITFTLTAKAIHPVDRQLVERVLVDIRDSRNILLGGAPFQLYDDGSLVSIGSGTSGDQVAADSVFTRAFQINSSNNPESYQLLFYALDPFGGSSDTISSSMTFIR